MTCLEELRDFLSATVISDRAAVLVFFSCDLCVFFFFFFSGPLSICKMRAEVTDLCFFLYSVLGIMKYENQTTWFCVQALPYTKSQTCGTHFFPLECEGFKIYISAESVISRIK